MRVKGSVVEGCSEVTHVEMNGFSQVVKQSVSILAKKTKHSESDYRKEKLVYRDLTGFQANLRE
jgi:hypothetical protein